MKYAVWVVLAVLVLLPFGCAMPALRPGEQPPATVSEQLDAWATANGLTPESVQGTAEAVKDVGAIIPPPVGSALQVLAGILGAGAVGWGAYRKKRNEAQEAQEQGTLVQDALRSLIDAIDALPAELRDKIIPSIQEVQERRGTRETVQTIRADGEVVAK